MFFDELNLCYSQFFLCKNSLVHYSWFECSQLTEISHPAEQSQLWKGFDWLINNVSKTQPEVIFIDKFVEMQSIDTNRVVLFT